MIVWVGPLVVQELKRIVESSEITKCVAIKFERVTLMLTVVSLRINREDDTNWPKKSIVGKQELEIRVGNDHIAFEVSGLSGSLPERQLTYHDFHVLVRRQKSAL